MPTEVPERSWSKLGVDLFEIDKQIYQILVDYYSNYFEVAKLTGSKASTVIAMLKANMARHGIPDEVVSDGAKYYDCEEFRKFSTTWCFKHTISYPYHSQSNGWLRMPLAYVKDSSKRLKLVRETHI